MDRHKLGYFAVTAFFIAICAPTLFSDGMFLDGVTYAAIAKNMANGFGEFWSPYYSDSLFPKFHEHPPLAIGIQAFFFKVFGDSIYVERIYSLATYLITGRIIVLIWKRITGSFQFGWLPMLLWFLVTDTVWACSNNMLENTMMIFTTLSFLWILKSEKKGLLWLIFAGISLFLALLCKGFTSLYIWAVPFFMWVFLRKETFAKMFLNSMILVAFTLIPIAIILLISDSALETLSKYITNQVVGGITKAQTVNSRFTIIFKFILTTLPSIILTGVIILIGKKKGTLPNLNAYKKIAFALISLTFAGILPIMISLKQRGFYILTVYPFFALGLSLLILPLVSKFKPLKINLVKAITLGVVTLALILSFINWGKLNRDHNLVNDCKLIVNKVGEGKRINICHDVRKRYNILAYYSRYGRISLMTSKLSNEEYLIIWKDQCFNTFQGNYTKVPIPTQEFHLFKKN